MLYDTALENWLKYFKLKQIHIVNSDILRVRLLQVMKQIENFLNIDACFTEREFYLNKTRGMFCLCIQQLFVGGKGQKTRESERNCPSKDEECFTTT